MSDNPNNHRETGDDEQMSGSRIVDWVKNALGIGQDDSSWYPLGSVEVHEVVEEHTSSCDVAFYRADIELNTESGQLRIADKDLRSEQAVWEDAEYIREGIFNFNHRFLWRTKRGVSIPVEQIADIDITVVDDE